MNKKLIESIINISRMLNEQHGRQGWDSLYDKLKDVNPESMKSALAQPGEYIAISTDDYGDTKLRGIQAYEKNDTGPNEIVLNKEDMFHVLHSTRHHHFKDKREASRKNDLADKEAELRSKYKDLDSEKVAEAFKNVISKLSKYDISNSIHRGAVMVNLQENSIHACNVYDIDYTGNAMVIESADFLDFLELIQEGGMENSGSFKPILDLIMRLNEDGDIANRLDLLNNRIHAPEELEGETGEESPALDDVVSDDDSEGCEDGEDDANFYKIVVTDGDTVDVELVKDKAEGESVEGTTIVYVPKHEIDALYSTPVIGDDEDNLIVAKPVHESLNEAVTWDNFASAVKSLSIHDIRDAMAASSDYIALEVNGYGYADIRAVGFEEIDEIQDSGDLVADKDEFLRLLDEAGLEHIINAINEETVTENKNDILIMAGRVSESKFLSEMDATGGWIAIRPNGASADMRSIDAEDVSEYDSIGFQTIDKNHLKRMMK